jgi:beta-lactamase class A
MLPFKKKKVDEEVDAKKEEIKKPRKKRKKVEPPKPWGKIERLIVLAFFVAMPALSLVFLVHAKNSKNAKPIPNDSQVLGDVISRTAPNTDILKDDLNNELSGLKGTYGIWVQSLDGSYHLGINENEKFDGASLFKLPLMIGYYEGIDSGAINSGTSYTLKYSDAAAGAGALSTLPPGTNVTYKDIVEAMGKSSDNAAFSIISNALENNAEVDEINQIGMTNTDFINSTTTPYDIGLLYFKLANGKLISNNSKNEMLNFLTNTDFEDLIPKGVPDDIRVAHKYGSDNGELNDAGIIFTNKPFILVILSKGIDPAESETEISKLTKIVYDWATK